MKKYENQLEVCIRAIIRSNGKILVCKNKKKGYYFFPGGHLEFGENIKEALAREIKEELDAIVKKFLFIGVVDNIFTEDGQKHHEINLVFEVKLDKIKKQSQEDHIDFALISEKDFSKEQILPVVLKKMILKWLRNKKIFWESQFIK